MTLDKSAPRDPSCMIVLWSLCYATIGAAFAFWSAGGTAAVAVVVGTTTACALSSLVIVRQLRRCVVVSVGLTVAGAGLGIASLLGRSAELTRLFGPTVMICVLFVLTFGFTGWGLTFTLRALAARHSWVAVLESAFLAFLFALPFSAHRDFQIGRPALLAEWTIAHGNSPQQLLPCGGIGLSCLLVVLHLRHQSGRRTICILTLLLMVSVAFATIFDRWQKVIIQAAQVPNRNDASGGSAGAPDRLTSSFDPRDRDRVSEPLAIVTLHTDFPPPKEGSYFRNRVFSELRDARLWRADDPRRDSDVPRSFPTELLTLEIPSRPSTVSPSTVPLVVSATVSLIRPSATPFGLVTAESFEPRETIAPDRFVRSYDVRSRVNLDSTIELARAKAGDPEWSADVRSHYLMCPPDARYGELAAKILGESLNEHSIKPEFLSSPMLRALALRRWLERNATYSLQPSKFDVPDPTAAFLFGDRRGFCVFVSHALAYLLRSQGIPTRVAEGFFVPAERHTGGSGLLVQSTDAHSWCEIYLQDIGWVVVDAALERSEEPGSPPCDPAVRNFFNDKNRPQNEMGDRSTASVSPVIRRLAFWAMILLPVGGYSIKAWRRLAPYWGGSSQLYRLCYRAALDRLAEAGLSRKLYESREDFALRVATKVPEFVPLSDAHLSSWLSGRSQLDRSGWLRLQSRVSTRLKLVTPRLRRLSGWIDPVSWWRGG